MENVKSCKINRYLKTFHADDFANLKRPYMETKKRASSKTVARKKRLSRQELLFIVETLSKTETDLVQKISDWVDPYKRKEEKVKRYSVPRLTFRKMMHVLERQPKKGNVSNLQMAIENNLVQLLEFVIAEIKPRNKKVTLEDFEAANPVSLNTKRLTKLQKTIEKTLRKKTVSDASLNHLAKRIHTAKSLKKTFATETHQYIRSLYIAFIIDPFFTEIASECTQH